jgi:hypothetical protein
VRLGAWRTRELRDDAAVARGDQQRGARIHHGVELDQQERRRLAGHRVRASVRGGVRRVRVLPCGATRATPTVICEGGVRTLVDLGADVEAQTADGARPLRGTLWASREGGLPTRLPPRGDVRVSWRAHTPSWVYTGDGSRADSGIPPAASRQLHSLTGRVDAWRAELSPWTASA